MNRFDHYSTNPLFITSKFSCYFLSEDDDVCTISGFSFSSLPIDIMMKMRNGWIVSYGSPIFLLVCHSYVACVIFILFLFFLFPLFTCSHVLLVLLSFRSVASYKDVFSRRNYLLERLVKKE